MDFQLVEIGNKIFSSHRVANGKLLLPFNIEKSDRNIVPARHRGRKTDRDEGWRSTPQCSAI